ncbi:hypothetical protein A8C32_14575 [Flavivirga aquatica]|uniref:Uncharacterized protein n=1 Tax=Flavivirga aquatica TaxID=1849968 RepID=A0A1E5TCL0_9FLAO|nr:hypothetical protein A8C32_14575 [Flavivirga aquatica]
MYKQNILVIEDCSLISHVYKTVLESTLKHPFNIDFANKLRRSSKVNTKQSIHINIYRFTTTCFKKTNIILQVKT